MFSESIDQGSPPTPGSGVADRLGTTSAVILRSLEWMSLNPDESATLRVTRVPQFISSLVRYRVLIDGEERSKLKSNSTSVISVKPGEHTVQVLGRFPSFPASNVISVNVPAGVIQDLECRTVRSIGSFLPLYSRTPGGAGKPPMSINLYEG